MTTRVHFHTDCYWFGGSEHTLALVAEDAAGREDVAATYTYRADEAYRRGLRNRVPSLDWAGEVRLPDVGAGAGWPRRLLLNRYTVVAWDTAVIYRELKRLRPHVLHVNNGGYPAAASCHAAALAGRLARVPVVVYFVNNLAFDYATIGRTVERPLDRLVVRAVSRFATASAHAAGVLREVLGLRTDQVSVLPNTVIERTPTRSSGDVRRELGVSPQTVLIVAIGKLEERKGHRVLIDALAECEDAVLDDVVVLVAGDGPEDTALRERVGRLGLEQRIRLIGPVDDGWDLLRAADIVVLPSVSHEDFPIVILEAMCAGKPVVASVVAGTPEQVVDGTTGLLVPPGDAGRLAAALVALVSDPDRRRRMGETAAERYRSSFTPERAIHRYWTLYRELLDEEGVMT